MPNGGGGGSSSSGIGLSVELDNTPPKRRSHPYTYSATPDMGRTSHEFSAYDSTNDDSVYVGMPRSGYSQQGGKRTGRFNRAFIMLACAGALVLSYTIGRRSVEIADFLGYELKEYKTLLASGKQMEQCGVCSTSPEECGEYGLESLQLARAYQGTGRRLRKVIRKAMRGEKIRTAVIGGSVSEGVGVEEGQRWHELVSSWFKTTFPSIDVEHVVGAVPGRGSEYFQSCHGEHIDKDVDVIVIELGINDWERADRYFRNMEDLLRAVLSYPNAPAVLFAECFTIYLPQLSTGADMHVGLANYYDTPMLSMRNWLLGPILEDDSLKDVYFFGDRDGTGQHNDYLHMSPLVHRALADHFAAMFNQQHCIVKNGLDEIPSAVASPWPRNHNLSTNRIPRLRLTDHYDATTVIPPPNSKCLSLNSPHPESVLTYSSGTHGWNPWEDSIPWRHVKKYMRANEVGARINFDVTLVTGSWSIYYLRSNKKPLGNVWCWSDERRDLGVLVEGWWERKMDVGEVIPIQDGLTPGKHVLSCEIVESTGDPGGGHEFLFVALMYV